MGRGYGFPQRRRKAQRSLLDGEITISVELNYQASFLFMSKASIVISLSINFS
jgi:hypothetical protein